MAWTSQLTGESSTICNVEFNTSSGVGLQVLRKFEMIDKWHAGHSFHGSVFYNGNWQFEFLTPWLRLELFGVVIFQFVTSWNVSLLTAISKSWYQRRLNGWSSSFTLFFYYYVLCVICNVSYVFVSYATKSLCHQYSGRLKSKMNH